MRALTCCWPERERRPRVRGQSAGVAACSTVPFLGVTQVSSAFAGANLCGNVSPSRRVDRRQCHENQGKWSVFQIKGDERGHRVGCWIGHWVGAERSARHHEAVCVETGVPMTYARMWNWSGWSGNVPGLANGGPLQLSPAWLGRRVSMHACQGKSVDCKRQKETSDKWQI